LNTTQIHIDYFDDDRKRDFGLVIEKDKESIINKIKLLSKEIKILKVRLNLEN